jgi:hypothetical protein
MCNLIQFHFLKVLIRLRILFCISDREFYYFLTIRIKLNSLYWIAFNAICSEHEIACVVHYENIAETIC